MVMIEAMACGTPVVALCRGAVPEVVVERHAPAMVCDTAGAAGRRGARRPTALDPARLPRARPRRLRRGTDGPALRADLPDKHRRAHLAWGDGTAARPGDVGMPTALLDRPAGRHSPSLSSAPPVRPRVPAVLRHVGLSLLTATVVPGLLFYVCLVTIGLWAALAAALLWCYGAIGWRLVTGRRAVRAARAHCRRPDSPDRLHRGHRGPDALPPATGLHQRPGGRWLPGLDDDHVAGSGPAGRGLLPDDGRPLGAAADGQALPAADAAVGDGLPGRRGPRPPGWC